MTTTKRTSNRELKEWVYSAESGIHGTGLYASKRIKKGEYIGTYWGPVAKRNGMYVLWVFDEGDEDNAIGRSGKNILRYLNHSRPGNVEFDGYDCIARKSIKQGDELSFDYQSDDFD